MTAIGRTGATSALPSRCAIARATVAREERVAAEHVVGTALFGAAGDDQDRGLALMQLVGDLSVREQLEIDDVVGVDRFLGLQRAPP